MAALDAAIQPARAWAWTKGPMISPLNTFIGRIRAISFAIKASDEAARARYEQAMSHLVRMYNVLGGEMPSASAAVDDNMLCSLVACKLGQYALAVDAAKIALGKIDSVSRYSAEEKNYLRYYCKVLLEFCEAKTNHQTFDSRLIDVKFSSLKPDKVRSAVKRQFPITNPAASDN